MVRFRLAVILCILPACLLIGGLPLSSVVTSATQQSENEQTIWHLEQAYWRYVEEDNLPAYLGLWHSDFLGWPSMSAAPVHKDHITDWITSQTSKGLAFKFAEFKASAIQLTGDVAVVCYWIRYKWVDKGGNGLERTLRVTHTWVKTADSWKIIGGMSMAETVTPLK